ncbi:MAG: hypothetical protein KGL39_02745 [Patescibacteria group bacterium]|nr:hypothetical protein [Patescibacteria group bacterium]
MKNRHRNHRRHANQQLRTAVLSGGAARQLKRDMVEARVEADPWYAYNMTRLVESFRLGRVARHIYKNVGERLQRIAHHRAASAVQGGF